MVALSLTKRVQAPPEKVFEVFSDFPKAADRISGITRLEVITDGPVGKGTRFRETRIMFKKEATEEMEITSFEPPRSYTVGCDSCGTRWTSTFRFQPAAGDATDVEVSMECTPLTFFARLMSPLGKLMAKSMTKCIDQDLEDLKKVAEGQG